MSDYRQEYNYTEGFDYQIPNKQLGKSDLSEIESQNADNSRQQRYLEPAEIKTLQKLQGAAHQYLLKHNIDYALAGYEKCLRFYHQSVGGDWTNVEYGQYFKETLVFLNDYALKYLKEERTGETLKILSRCDYLTDGTELGFFPAMRNLTFNHIACCFRRLGKLDEALKYLYRALEFGISTERMDTRGITHINLCAILSQLDE